VGVGSAGCGDPSCKCAEPVLTDSPRMVAPDEPTALGFTANEVKARLAGPWTGPLSWSADPAKVTAHPATGTTAITLALRYAFQELPIFVHEPAASPDASGSLARMDLPVHLLITSADGALAEDHTTSVRATSLTRGSLLDIFPGNPGIPTQGSYTATVVDTARYTATQHRLMAELSPESATGVLVVVGLGSAKSPDGQSDVKIADELPVATFSAAAP